MSCSCCKPIRIFFWYMRIGSLRKTPIRFKWFRLCFVLDFNVEYVNSSWIMCTSMVGLYLVYMILVIQFVFSLMWNFESCYWWLILKRLFIGKIVGRSHIVAIYDVLISSFLRLWGEARWRMGFIYVMIRQIDALVCLVLCLLKVIWKKNGV